MLCAGAFGSPKLLMLSGIGPADELRRHGIPVVADVAQVGQNLQNHPGVDVQWAADHQDSLTSEIGVAGRARLAAEWGLRRRGLGATNFFEAGAFLRTNDHVSFPDMQYEFLALTRRLVNGKLVPVPGFQFWMDLSRPHSRGQVSAALGGSRGTAVHRVQPPRRPARPDRPGRRHPADPRDRRPAGLDALQPRRAHARTGRHQRRRARRPSSAASSARRTTPPARCGWEPTWRLRSIPQGRFRAVAGLRVVDASIMPKVVTANLNAPVMMMAEKIADQILGRPALAAEHVDVYRRTQHQETT